MALLEKVTSMTNEGIQKWLRTVDPTELGIALMGEPEDIRSCILRNMSNHASTILSADIKRYRKMDAKDLIVHMAGCALRTTL